jgi:2-methoxy-6-polyprenyl-1,4-benzoquinol methylase
LQFGVDPVVLGDIALRFLNYAREVHQDHTAQVTIADINPAMLAHGEKKFRELGVYPCKLQRL